MAALAALGVLGDADAGQVRGQLVAADVVVLRQLRKWGRLCRLRGHGAPLQRTGMTGYPTILHASAEPPSVAGMVENRSSEMSVRMLSPASAAEVSEADAGRYNAGAVLPQGASDVQSIRASQTADPRAKQTHPFGPARRSARVNTRRGDGDSPGSMTARRFHLGEVVESCLAQPLSAGLTAAALPRASLLRTRAGGGSA